MKYLFYVVIIAVIVVAGYFIYNKYWQSPGKPHSQAIQINLPDKPKQAGKQSTLPLYTGDSTAKTAAPVNTAPSDSDQPLTPEKKLMQQARAAKNDAEAVEIYKKIVAEYTDTVEAITAAIVLGDQFVSEENYQTARSYYTFAYKRLPTANREGVYSKITGINDKLVWSNQVYPNVKDTVLYQVQPKDYLEKIAIKFNCPCLFIQKINGLSDTAIAMGQRLKVIKGVDSDNMKMEIFVSKSEYTLTIYINGYLLKKYPVGIGRENLTPEATFKVVDRIERPDWLRPGETIPYGDPRNILGDYYIKFQHETLQGFGIHGTRDTTIDPKKPETIQKAASAGCIRMFDKDIAELFAIVPRGTMVEIKK
jgi:lipoprotein-anchoring transpeptidase ErfK/SrfK